MANELNKDLYTNKEVGEYLHMSDITLWRERKAGRLGFRRSAGKLLYTQADVDDYLELVRNRPANAQAIAVAA